MVSRLIASCMSIAVLLGSATAAPLTIDFDELALGGESNRNFESGGFRFSPDCHVDIVANRLAMTSTGIGWDSSGCGTLNNADYLGAGTGITGGVLYIDNAGSPFSLLSIREMAYDSYPRATAGTFYSSKGGVLSLNTPAGVTYGSLWDYNFVGDAWTNVDWIVATNGGGGPQFFLDSITFDTGTVPEPNALLLVLMAGGLLVMARRRAPASLRAASGPERQGPAPDVVRFQRLLAGRS